MKTAALSFPLKLAMRLNKKELNYLWKREAFFRRSMLPGAVSLGKAIYLSVKFRGLILWEALFKG